MCLFTCLLYKTDTLLVYFHVMCGQNYFVPNLLASHFAPSLWKLLFVTANTQTLKTHENEFEPYT